MRMWEREYMEFNETWKHRTCWIRPCVCAYYFCVLVTQALCVSLSLSHFVCFNFPSTLYILLLLILDFIFGLPFIQQCKRTWHSIKIVEHKAEWIMCGCSMSMSLCLSRCVHMSFVVVVVVVLWTLYV